MRENTANVIPKDRVHLVYGHNGQGFNIEKRTEIKHITIYNNQLIREYKLKV